MSLTRLIELIAPGRRLWARSGWLLVEHLDGTAPVETAWSEAEHTAALETLRAGPLRFADGSVAQAFGGTAVVTRALDPRRRSEDVAADGLLSLLAARLLAQATALGRNILVTGPCGSAVAIIGGLLAEAHRSLVVGGPADAAPPAWPIVASVSEVHALGAERVGAWSLSPVQVVELLEACTGVIAWLDAGRLDRLLMRFEAAAAGVAPAPLRVLAGIDLAVVIGRGGRVREIAEIDLLGEGYRPRLLFTTGLSPAPTALVPVSLPSFVDELAAVGQGLLADELRAAVPQPGGARALAWGAMSSDEPGEVEPRATLRRGRPVAVPTATPVVVPPEAPGLDPALAAAPPPGWELDRLADGGEETPEDEITTEDAIMAATYGLAPPPRPPGVVAESTSFAEALARARDRDAQPSDAGNETAEADPGTRRS